MKKGRVIIDYESDDLGKCNYNIKQDGKNDLDKENLISLFEHILSELMMDQF